MLFHLHRDLACGPAVAFGLLVDPAALNRWSTSPIRGVAPGDGGHPNGIGALRSVGLPGRHGSLEEVVVDAEPSRRLVFRAVGSGVIRGHRTEVQLQALGPNRTRVEWKVDVDLRGPLLSLPARLHLGHELASSLDRLVELSSQVRTTSPYPERRDLDEAPRLPGLRLAAERAEERLVALAEELGATNDDRAGMASGLARALRAVIDEVRAGEVYLQPGFVLRLLPAMAEGFESSLARSLGRSSGAVAPAYAHAFAAARPGDTVAQLGRRALAAFAESELPRLVLELHAASYRGLCDPARFRADVYELGEHLAAVLVDPPSRRPFAKAPEPDPALARALRRGFERGVAPFETPVAGASLH